VTRPVCLHFHIFKNAGMTIEWMLQKKFSKNFAWEAYEFSAQKIIPIEVLMSFLRKNPNIVAFSSHNIRFPIPSDSEIDFISMIFIRNPIDRAVSVYGYNQRHYQDKDPSKLAKNMSLKEYVIWNLVSNNRLMNDSQLQFLSDKSLEKKSERLETVFQLINNCSIIGIVDRFDESMVLAEEILKKHFKKTDLAYLRQNVTPGREEKLENRLNSIKNELGDGVVNKLIKMNESDQEIYSHANNELNKRVKLINDFENKLDNFKQRCHSLNQQKDLTFSEGVRVQYIHEQNLLQKI